VGVTAVLGGWLLSALHRINGGWRRAKLSKGKGGRPPRSLVKLFKLRYVKGVVSRKEQASALGVSEQVVSNYWWRLKKRIPNSDYLFNNQNSSLRPPICPECLSPTLMEDHDRGEVVCTTCGAVADEIDELSDDLPFDTTYALTNHLAFGKSLGGTLPGKQLYKVLALGPNGTKDLPIRSTQIQVLSSAMEPPVVKTMLNYGSRMLKELGLDRDEDACHVLSDEYGKSVRMVAAFLQVSKMKVQPHLVARAALYHLLIQLYPEKAEDARWRFPFQERHLELVEQLALLTNRAEAKKG